MTVHYLALAGKDKGTMEYFLRELQRQKFPTDKKLQKEKNLCNCSKKKKAHFRELRLFEITVPEDIELPFDYFLDTYFSNFPHNRLSKFIFRRIAKMIGFGHKKSLQKLDFNYNGVGMGTNTRSHILFKVKEKNLLERVIKCGKCKKNIIQEWL